MGDNQLHDLKVKQTYLAYLRCQLRIIRKENEKIICYADKSIISDVVDLLKKDGVKATLNKREKDEIIVHLNQHS